MLPHTDSPVELVKGADFQLGRDRRAVQLQTPVRQQGSRCRLPQPQGKQTPPTSRLRLDNEIPLKNHRP